MPSDVRIPGGTALASPNSVRRRGGTVPAAANDVRRNKGACECCGGGEGGCRRQILGCETPWSAAVGFTLSGITPPTYLGCCKWDPDALPDCLNRDWGLPELFGDDAARSGCSRDYLYLCASPADFNAGDNSPVLGVLVNIAAGFTINTADHTMLVTLGIAVRLEASFGAGGGACFGERFYQRLYPLAGFPCDGPWDVDDTGHGYLAEEVDVGGWPATLTLAPTDTPTTDCCDAPAEGSCTPVTYNCATGPPASCTDPGDGTGTYTGPTALADCMAACGGGGGIPATYNCDPGPPAACVDPGDGSGVYTGPDALADCQAPGHCGPAGGGDPRDECCPGGSPPDQLSYFINAVGTFNECSCFVSSGTAAWDAGEGAYVAGLPGLCGSFMAVKVRCVGGTWFGEVLCGTAVIALIELRPQVNGICFPATSEFESLEIAGGGTTTPSPCCPVSTHITFAARRPFGS